MTGDILTSYSTRMTNGKNDDKNMNIDGLTGSGMISKIDAIESRVNCYRGYISRARGLEKLSTSAHLSFLALTQRCGSFEFVGVMALRT